MELMPLILKSNPQDEDVVIDLIGEIDEGETWPKVKPRLSQRIIFDCGHLRRINSYGSMMWSNWIRTFDSRQQFVFRHVLPLVVGQFNMIDSFLPENSVVESVYVPYECDKCDNEQLFLAERGKHYVEGMNNKPASIMLPPEINCIKCDGRAKPNVFESKYWKFLGFPANS